jgi:transposase
MEEQQTERIEYTRIKRKGKRDEFYKDIPVKQKLHELPEKDRFCQKCGKPLRECGREVVRCELEHIPASVTKIEHVQVIYDCCGCNNEPDAEKRTIVKANVPAPVIPNSGIASPSLVAYVVSNKYVLALPLNRQADEFKRLNINIPRQNLANWVIFAANAWLAPMWSMLKDELLTNEIIHADESTHLVVNEKGRTAKQKSYMWGYFTGRGSPHQIALFEYQETRSKEHPMNFLKGYSGKLHVDAYAGYLGLEAQGIILSYCWSHVRRKFVDALKPVPVDGRKNLPASIGVRFCDHLFFLEKYYDEEHFTREQRERWRELLSLPLAEDFFAWAERMLPKVNHDSLFGKAVSYALNCKERLKNAFYDGRLELSNNRSERNFRMYAVGRGNWKFSYSPEGAKASAICYSIVETALANGLVPYLYLGYLFKELPNIPKERFNECLPWNSRVIENCAVPDPRKTDNL